MRKRGYVPTVYQDPPSRYYTVMTLIDGVNPLNLNEMMRKAPFQYIFEFADRELGIRKARSG